MHRRAFGIETEYGVSCTRNGLPHSATLMGDMGGFYAPPGYWSVNGARVYDDVGHHPEYCTPECQKIEDLIAHLWAGHDYIEALADRRLNVLNDNPAGDVFTLAVYANNVCNYGTGSRDLYKFASHENYSTNQLPYNGDEVKRRLYPLLAYLATRNLVVGAGRLVLGPDKTRFEISQRGAFADSDFDTGTTNMMPVINLRREEHGAGQSRLHVICGDSNISPLITGVRVAMMCALLTLLEERRLRGLEVGNGYTIMRLVSANPRSKFHAGGRQRTALNVQRFYFDQAYELVSSTPEMSHLLSWIELYGRHLDRLAASLNPENHLGHLDWATKKIILDRWIGRRPNSSMDRWQGMELEMHRVHRDSWFYALANRFGELGSYREAILQAKISPPADTRAHVRGMAVRAGWKVDWETICPKNRSALAIDLNDPLDTTIPELLAQALNGS